MDLNKKDIKVEKYTNSSPEVTMYLTHIPTGVSVKGIGKKQRELKEKLIRDLENAVYRKISISTTDVKTMLGGEWPEFKGFGFDQVNHYEVHDGELVPCDMCGDFVPGPNFKLIMSDLNIMW